MKLINIKGMSQRQERAYRLCMAGSALPFDRDAASDALQTQLAAIEPEAKVLGRALAVPHLGRIDLVCVDAEGRLIAACISEEITASETGAALMRGQWASENIDMLQHIYSRRFKDSEVRVWLVAGRVSPEASVLISRMAASAPELFTCEGMELAGESWLVVRRQGAAQVLKPPEPPPSPGPDEKEDRRDVLQPLGIRSVLTRQEIDDFFAPAGDEEEITNGGSVFRDL